MGFTHLLTTARSLLTLCSLVLTALTIAPLLLLLGGLAYFRWYRNWEAKNTGGMSYYGRTLDGRRKLKKVIARHAVLLIPFARCLAWLPYAKNKYRSFKYHGVAAPSQVCSPEMFDQAVRYQPTAQDVFIVTQMRSGTTWMQYLVYEIFCKGDGSLVDTGSIPLYAVSPWIEAKVGITMALAPLIGEEGRRVIKTHLPTTLCPYSPEAKYIYVARHPISCFASCVDLMQLLAGPFATSEAELLNWFCSDEMYWSPWPVHVAGWWDWHQEKNNVLFIHYEEMKADLMEVVKRVSQFLNLELTALQQRRIVSKLGFSYMKLHEELFEPSPPTLFSLTGSFLLKDSVSYYPYIQEADRQRIMEYCHDRLKGRAYSAVKYYPAIF